MGVGRWVASDTRWFEMKTCHCALCGQIIPSRIWQVDIDDLPRNFCAPACEDLYRRYLMPQAVKLPAGSRKIG
jgi:hypothetical protein